MSEAQRNEHPHDRLVRALGLDRRKRYAEWMGVLCTIERTTDICTGCSDLGDYGTVYGPFGCKECGYTGKRRITFPAPVLVDGDVVHVRPNTI